jgi:hypothetical protein
MQALLKNNVEMKRFILHARFLGRLGYYLFNAEFIKDQYTSLTEPLPVVENESFLQLNKNVELIPINNFHDFENPLNTDFQKLFQLFWQLLRYCRIEGRDNYSKFLYHDSSLDYPFKESELKALQLNPTRIKKMFDHVDRNDRKTKRIICKIVAFFSYGSLEDSNASFEFIKNGFATKDVEDVFQMIQILCKVNDHFQIDRNRILLREILAFLHQQVDQMDLSDAINIIKKLINTNSSFTSALKEKTTAIPEIIRILNNAQEGKDPFNRVDNYLMREEINKELARHRDFFDDLRTYKKTEFGNDPDSQNEEDPSNHNFKRGQTIRYYDPKLERAFRGTIENVYENLIKVKLNAGDVNPTYKLLDEEDFSNIILIS